jgi:hypothetical protein
VISWGEHFLERAKKVAHDIEEHVRQLLDVSTIPIAQPSPDFARISHAGDEAARNEVSVDNRGRDG